MGSTIHFNREKMSAVNTIDPVSLPNLERVVILGKFVRHFHPVPSLHILQLQGVFDALLAEESLKSENAFGLRTESAAAGESVSNLYADVEAVILLNDLALLVVRRLLALAPVPPGVFVDPHEAVVFVLRLAVDDGVRKL